MTVPTQVRTDSEATVTDLFVNFQSVGICLPLINKTPLICGGNKLKYSRVYEAWSVFHQQLSVS